MPTIRVTGYIDEHHRLSVEVPASVPPGPVEILVVLPDAREDDPAQVWMAGIAREWAAELSDPREDIYNLSDGEAIKGRCPIPESRRET
jgi:hypothetical protein